MTFAQEDVQLAQKYMLNPHTPRRCPSTYTIPGREGHDCNCEHCEDRETAQEAQTFQCELEEGHKYPQHNHLLFGHKSAPAPSRTLHRSGELFWGNEPHRITIHLDNSHGNLNIIFNNPESEQ